MAAVAVSSVLTEQTNQHSAQNFSYASYSRHPVYPQWLAAERTYGYLDVNKDRSRVERLRACRRYAWFARHTDTGAVRVISNSCHLRWCPVCAESRKNYITFGVTDWIREAPHPKFLTLTLRHTTSPLYFQVKDLYDSFKKLRRLKLFKSSIPGGVWFFQVKKSDNDNLWHPHLHCLIYGDYIPIRYLKKAWSKITSGSDIVDIRPIQDAQSAASDVARYASSPGSLVGLSLDDSCELVDAMDGRRICGTWGTGRVVSLRPAKIEDKAKWVNIGSWGAVVEQRTFDRNADAIWYAWRHGSDLPAGIDVCLTDDFLNGILALNPNDLELDQMYSHGKDPP